MIILYYETMILYGNDTIINSHEFNNHTHCFDSVNLTGYQKSVTLRPFTDIFKLDKP